MRIGFGYDVHRLVEGRKLILGGIEIPHNKGLLGHSDADVLIHAVVDALLGAVAKGDIGKLFPDTDTKYKDADSMIFLDKVNKLLKSDGYTISNIDSTIVVEKPKLAPYVDSMRENISRVLGIDIGQISIKAKSEEGLGFTGTGEGIKAYAIVCVEK